LVGSRSSAQSLRVGNALISLLGSGLESIERLFGSGIDREHHALLAVVRLETEEPERSGISHRERPGGEFGCVGSYWHETGRDTNNVGSNGGVGKLRAWCGEGRLRSSVVLRREDKRDDVTRAGSDVAWVVGQRAVETDHDGVRSTLSRDGEGSEKRRGGQSEQHFDQSVLDR